MKLTTALLLNYQPHAILPAGLLDSPGSTTLPLNRYETLIDHLSMASPDSDIHVITETRKIKTRYTVFRKNNLTFHFIRREPYNLAPFYFFLPGTRRIRSVLRNIDPDMVVGFGTDDPYGWEAACSGYPFIVCVQGIIQKPSPWLEWSMIRKQFIKYMEKETVSNASGIIVENEFPRHFSSVSPG